MAEIEAGKVFVSSKRIEKKCWNAVSLVKEGRRYYMIGRGESIHHANLFSGDENFGRRRTEFDMIYGRHIFPCVAATLLSFFALYPSPFIFTRSL